MMYIAHDIHCSCMVKHLPSYVHRHYTRAMTTHMHWFPSILTKDLVQLSSSCRPGMLFLRCLAVYRIVNPDPVSTKKDVLLSLANR